MSKEKHITEKESFGRFDFVKSVGLFGGISLVLVLASLGYSGKFKLGFPNHFTRRNNIEVYIPHIFKQLSGKNKSNYVYFPFYEGWKEYYNSIEDYRNSSDKRIFLHSYLNQNITI